MPRSAMACTYDISARGARITTPRFVNEVGEIIAVERGHDKAYCRVVWVGEPNSRRRGQMGIQCVETERLLWDTERRHLEGVYDRILHGWDLWRNDERRRDDGLGRRPELDALGRLGHRAGRCAASDRAC